MVSLEFRPVVNVPTGVYYITRGVGESRQFLVKMSVAVKFGRRHFQRV
jgi:hypothetical protein